MINSHKKDPETGKVPPEAMVSVVAIAAVLVPVRTCRSSSFLIRIELELQAKFREQKELQVLKFVLQLHFLPQCSNADSDFCVGRRAVVCLDLHTAGTLDMAYFGRHSFRRRQHGRVHILIKLSCS